MYILADNDKTV